MQKQRIVSLFLAGSLLFQAAGADAVAAQTDVPAAAESVEEPAEEPQQGISDNSDSSHEEQEETPAESIPGGEEETPAEPLPEEEETPVELLPEEEETPVESLPDENSVSENTVSENTVSENTLPGEEENIFAVFPGLGDGCTLSAQQLADKKVLASHMDDIAAFRTRSANAYADAEGLYAPGEVVYLADTRTKAEQAAEAFGGTLDSYSYEVAVITLPEEATVAMAVAAAADPDIKLPAVWPNYYSHLDSDDMPSRTVHATNDSDIGRQWQHDYIGTTYAWGAGYKGQGIKVAVIDTGLRQSHEDLAENAVAGRNFVNGAEGTEYSEDNAEHGTHVAGITAAEEHNWNGGAGIAPDAQIRGYAVVSPFGSMTADSVLRAVNAAVEDQNDIINMSLGNSLYDDNFAKVIKNAYNNGVAVFASAGDDDSDGINFPAAYSGAICVGAVDQNSAKASFSNYGRTVALSFPGVGIYSTLPEGGNSYGYMSGTSQAAPAAAGTAAVILSAREDIRKKTGKAKVNALLSAMKSSTVKSASSGMGAGTTWLPGVLKLATDTAAPIAPTIEFHEDHYDKAKGSSNYIEECVTVFLSVKTAVGIVIYYSTDGKTPVYKNNEVINGTPYYPAYDHYGITLKGSGKVTIKAMSLNPVTGKTSRVVSRTFSLTPRPQEVALTPANHVSCIAAGKSLKFTTTVTPSYSLPTKAVWQVDNEALKAGITVSGGTVKTKKTTPPGNYTVTATLLLKNGGDIPTIQDSYTFTVIPAEKADIQKIAFQDEKGKTLRSVALHIPETLDLKKRLKITKTDRSVVTDVSANAVVWTSSNPGIVSVEDGVVTAVSPGKATVKVVTNDSLNRSASCSVTVAQPVTDITLCAPNGRKITYQNPAKVAAGRSIDLSAQTAPANASNKKITWSVEGNDKVTISAKGRLTAKKDAAGTCTVKAAAQDGSGILAKATVTILSGEITNISLSDQRLTLFIPTLSDAPVACHLKMELTGTEGFDRNQFHWTSSDESIVSIYGVSVMPGDNGGIDTALISAEHTGKAVITCAATDGSGVKASCTVNVFLPMSGLAIGPTDGWGCHDDNTDTYDSYIAVGKSIRMSAKYSSSYGVSTSKKITWSSSNPDAVSVDRNGKVTAAKTAAAGSTAVITATAADGSGITSNKYRFTVTPLYRKIRIEYADRIETPGGGYRERFKVLAEDAQGNLCSPPYFTVSVSGGSNPGCGRKFQDARDGKAGYYYLQPVPGKATTTKSPFSSSLTARDYQKMTITVQFKDGSRLKARYTVPTVRFSNGSFRYLCDSHT